MVGNKYISASQIRAARGLLNWSQDELAEKTDLSITTIRKIESGHISPRDTTNDKICAAFENAGLEFIEPNGVRERPDNITIYEGAEGARDFQQDVYNIGIKDGRDIAQVWPSKTLKKFLKMLGDYRNIHVKRMIAAQNLVRVKCVLTEDPTWMHSPFIEYRFLPRSYVDSAPFYVYGDKLAVFDFQTEKNGRIIVVTSKALADTFRLQFISMWEKATPLINPDSELHARQETPLATGGRLR